MSDTSSQKNVFGKKVLSPQSNDEENASKKPKSEQGNQMDTSDNEFDVEDFDGELDDNEAEDNASGGAKDSLDSRIDDIDQEIAYERQRVEAIRTAKSAVLRARAAEEKCRLMEAKMAKLQERNDSNPLSLNINNARPSTSNQTQVMQSPPGAFVRTLNRPDPNMIGTSEMVIMHRDYPATLIDDAAFAAIEKKLNVTAAQHAVSRSKIKVIIDDIVNKQGAIIVSCRTPGTAEWIKSIADKILDLYSCSRQEANLEPAFMIWVPDSDATYDDVIKAFQLQDIDVGQWSLLKAFPKERKTGRRFIVLAGEDLSGRVGSGQLRLQYLVYRVKAVVYQLGLRTREELNNNGENTHRDIK